MQPFSQNNSETDFFLLNLKFLYVHTNACKLFSNSEQKYMDTELTLIGFYVRAGSREWYVEQAELITHSFTVF